MKVDPFDMRIKGMREEVMRVLQARPQYLNELSVEPQLIQDLCAEARIASEELSKSSISISSHEGLMLSRLISWSGCQRFVEIGTLTGYSALWILTGLKGPGEMITLEKDPVHASQAQSILNKAAMRFSEIKIRILEGDARQTLPSIEGPVDGVFIDGNKLAYGDYLDWAEKNVRPGGIIIVDNVFLWGAVYGENSESPPPASEKQVRVMKDVNARLMDSQKYSALFIPTEEGLLAARKLF